MISKHQAVTDPNGPTALKWQNRLRLAGLFECSGLFVLTLFVLCFLLFPSENPKIRAVSINCDQPREVAPYYLVSDTVHLYASTMVKPLRWTSKRRETPNTIATTIDLPPELWLEILSYLPDIYFRKMMGVSRILYALALREIYRELDLHHPNSRTMLQLNKWFE